MKISRVAKALSHIDDELIECAENSGVNKKDFGYIRWLSAAACFVLMLTASLLVIPRFIDSGDIPVDTDIGEQETGIQETSPAVYSESYVYRVDDPSFSSYIGGKVIAGEKLGEKIGTVTVTAGWERGGERLSEEHLRAEVYEIEGVSRDKAVALRFLDKGDALTLTHYYVILDPEEDLSELQEYVIGAITPTEGEYGEETTADGTVESFTEPRAE